MNINLKKNKYKNKEITIDNITFQSIAEGRRYKELKLLEQAGEISKLELQPKFTLQESFRKNGKTYRKIEYRGDFMYCQCRQNDSRRCKRNADRCI